VNEIELSKNNMPQLHHFPKNNQIFSQKSGDMNKNMYF